MELLEYLPASLREDFTPLACLKDSGQRQTLLLFERESCKQWILKRSANRESVEAEFQLLRQLAGSGIPAARAWLQEGAWAFLLREYIPGETLLDYAQKRGPLSQKEVRQIGLSLCAILKGLHRQTPPVIHRDIKPENIIRAPDGQLWLIDFGIARLYEAEACRDTQVLGTPATAPPEQFGYSQTDPRSDVYALGVLLHELSTGSSRLDQGTPGPMLRPVLRRCTRFAPEGRYPDAAAVERALCHAPLRFYGQRIAAGAAALGLVFSCLRLAHSLSGAEEPAPPASPPAALQEGAPDTAAESPQPEPYSFASPAIEAEVCRQLGKTPGTVTAEDLLSIDTLLLYGEQCFDSWEQLVVAGRYATLDGVQVTSYGSIDTVEDLAQMKNLRTLALCFQRLSDITPLEACDALTSVALAGNSITDVSPLAACQRLTTLIIADNPISDLSPLAACPLLTELNAGATALQDLSGLREFKSLSKLHLHDAEALVDISDLPALSTLHTLFLRPVTADQLPYILESPQLLSLFLWSVEGMSDLTPLGVLPSLQYLFLHQDALTSLEGAAQLPHLLTFQLICRQSLELNPLTQLTSLQSLDVRQMETDDWTPLGSIPTLQSVQCTPEQAEAIRGALGEPQFALVS